MHRVGLRCLTRGHVEEAWIEKARLVDEAAKRGMTGIPDFPRWVIMGLDIESIFGYL